MLTAQQTLRPDILALVNKARIALEMAPLKKLPRGVPQTSRKCVLGRSLGLEVLLDDQDRPYALVLQYHRARRLARIWCVARPHALWNGWAVMLPHGLSEFIREFDSRCYPKLVAASREEKSGQVRSDLRALRFDLMEEQTRVADLLAQAWEACQRADKVRQLTGGDVLGRSR
jgi:hypothetical protein